MATEVKKIHLDRYLRLKQLVEERFEGNQRKLADAIGKSPGYVNFLLNDPSLSHHKNLGEGLAREIEAKLGLPRAWLDRDAAEGLSSVSRSAFAEQMKRRLVRPDNPSYNDVRPIDAVELKSEETKPYSWPFAVRQEWVRSFKIDRNAIAYMIVSNNSMAPEIEDGDVIMLDTSVLTFDEDGVYVIEIDGTVMIRRLVRKTFGFEIRTPNPKHTIEEVSPEQMADLPIIGRVFVKIKPVF